MPRFEQFGGFGGPGAKSENPDTEKRMAEARKAGLRREGEEARDSLKKAFEAAGLDEAEKNPEEESKEKVAA
ncbi:MAG: hypothetical protein PHZ04_02020 [Patescibacteria group bacterium]|nr:hypothetical protein [Patescibacteria group bacterium]MDD5555002.1 hypothetical protein [Patescibacteria group bacterium]